ncbi:isopenicillin N synthase family dioxygenase [Nocardia pseudobrasiliensis]|uniref:Isopenicillin N synthase-like dioxygenase n=1 Tax=Nocardia pseudobrasiliensis TaxID=45979 RepID=A0A370IEB8_9NOCA|nr:2OG-Fe(II) oxygenase family protein [Nocardia pseudobrasiliensis]RDI69059.1 isopenicillin N synthase-like dioxygenase [Nocardia pseudobrasiliensis]
MEQVIPVIDLSNRDTADGRRSIAAAFDRACSDGGFFVIIGHGVPQELIDRTYATTAALFALSDEEKDAIAARPGFGGLFRSTTAARTRDNDTPPDLAELFGVHVKGDLPEAERAELGDEWLPARVANLWPTKPAEFRGIWNEYIDAMTALSAELVHLMALGLGLNEDYLDDRFANHMSSLSANYYYPQIEAPLPGQLRRGAHSDFSAVTVLYQDNDIGGLQVQARTGEWLPVPAVPGSFVVNIGDVMARWTGGRWISAMHRVVNPVQGHRSSRISIPFFYQADPAAPFEPIPLLGDSAEENEPADITVGEWISRKSRAFITA